MVHNTTNFKVQSNMEWSPQWRGRCWARPRRRRPWRWSSRCPGRSRTPAWCSRGTCWRRARTWRRSSPVAARSPLKFSETYYSTNVLFIILTLLSHVRRAILETEDRGCVNRAFWSFTALRQQARYSHFYGSLAMSKAGKATCLIKRH